MNRTRIAALSLASLTALGATAVVSGHDLLQPTIQMTELEPEVQVPALPFVPAVPVFAALVASAPRAAATPSIEMTDSAPVEHRAMAVHIAPQAPGVEAAAVVQAQEAAVVVAPSPPPPPPITLVAKVDLATQRMTVIENGKARFTWTISSGAKGYDTPRGTFKPDWMAKEWYSRKYDNAPMPHSVFFKDGAAIHATMNMGSLGTPASHGCVRLAPANAAKFFALVRQHSMIQTRIQVFGQPRHAPEAIAQRRPAVAAPHVAYATHYYGAPVVRGGGYYGAGGAVFAPGAKPARVVQLQPRGVRY